MLLRIIDSPASENIEDSVRIIFENNEDMDDFVTEPYSSPIYQDFHNTLAWYFSEYPKQFSDKGDLGVVEKLIKFGQYIGDELLGEDHQLIKIKEEIEEQGYPKLDVRIESARVEFFKELWETLILHESKYVLSAVVKGFTRKILEEKGSRDYPELRYELKVDLPILDSLNSELQTDKIKHEEIPPKKPRPLNILYLISRPDTLNLDNSNAINLSLQAVSNGDVVKYEVYQANDWKQLRSRLTDENLPIHILHYDGPVIIQDNGVCIVAGKSVATKSLVTMSELCEVLVDNKVASLSLDARVYLEDNKAISASQGLAKAAQSAHQQGLGNVIGLGQITNPWISGKCFESVYAQIAKGLSLGQAVVEARKQLQSDIETSLFTVKAIPFHPWSLLTHYSQQSVYFFESSQAKVDPNFSQITEAYQEKLYGFRAEMLPPLLSQASDGQIFQVIERLNAEQNLASNQSVAIVGEAGIGKSQLAHLVSLYLAQKKKIDYGFYFDFSQHYYSQNDMLEMIAPVLKLDSNQKEEVKQSLVKLHCCFVLDNFSQENHNNESEETKQTLNLFLQTLLSQKHKVIVINGSPSNIPDPFKSNLVEVTPLTLTEQKLIAAKCLADLNLNQETLVEISQNQDWDNLLISCDGHPWLTKKTMHLLDSFTAGELKFQIDKNLHKSDSSKIKQFQQWQWDSLQPVWQHLLILSSQVDGLLFETLMIAAEQKEKFPPAEALFELLGEPSAKLSDGLDILTKAGFLFRLPHGRIVEPRCLSFLQTKAEYIADIVNQQKLQLCFSQLICEGIRLLSLHVIKQPNPSVSNNLLLNRRVWVEHFENLWFNQDYRGFIGVKNAFEQLLLQAKLERESKAWSLDLLTRTPVVTSSEDTNIETQLSWLVLASSVLTEDDAINSECIMQGEKIWRSWFNSLAEPVDKKQLMLFQQVITFLERFYERQSSWSDCILVGEKAYKTYTQYDAWKRVIHSLRSLAKYNSQLGKQDKALYFENKILDDIPYTESPLGFKTQQMLDIVLARITRGDIEQAQVLLDDIRSSDEAEKLAYILNGFQCDIDYQNGNYSAALPHYCNLWVAALSSNQPVQIKQLKSRLLELEQKLGTEYFEEHYARAVPQGTINPKEYDG